MHQHGWGQHDSNNDHNLLRGWGEWLVAWLVQVLAHVQMGTIADNGLATNINQPQNRDGDGVGDKLEEGWSQTQPETT